MIDGKQAAEMLASREGYYISDYELPGQTIDRAAPILADAIRQKLTVCLCAAMHDGDEAGQREANADALKAIESIAAILDAMAGPAVNRDGKAA